MFIEQAFQEEKKTDVKLGNPIQTKIIEVKRKKAKQKLVGNSLSLNSLIIKIFHSFTLKNVLQGSES